MIAATLVVELLTEELPPKALRRLGDAFATAVAEGLRKRAFLSDESTITSYATPRRLAVSITHVMATVTTPATPVALLPVTVAFAADGSATEALAKALKSKTGFDRLESVPPERLERRHDGKLERVFYVEPPVAVQLRSALQESLDEAILKLPIPKVMSYPTPPSKTSPGSYFNSERFVRPAHSLLALYGQEIVPVEALGMHAVDAGDITQGHRFLGPSDALDAVDAGDATQGDRVVGRADVRIGGADSYALTLEDKGKVIPGFDARRAAILHDLEAKAAGATIIMPDALLDEVTALVEWPAVYAATFDPAFLAVPQECLILTMQQNQRYFALADAEGKLTHRFLLVSNLATSDPSAIVQGNERVLRARLADAKFFFDQDRRHKLETRVEKLRGVVHHNKLGTQGERVERLRSIARAIAPLIGAEPNAADRAALLAKADLPTDMVGEFPELQGTMGRYYALHDGESAVVADAIAQHYWPRYAGDALPDTPVAQAVALADKLEALAGMFGIGQVPTGDKDPFGLRRAALGVIRILVERHHHASLSGLADLAFDAFNAVPAVKRDREPLLDFLYDRLRGYLRDGGYSALQVAAVLDSRPDAIDDLPARLAAVREFEALPEAQALAAANKRIVNILRKSGSEAAAAPDPAKFADGAERDLYTTFNELEPGIRRAFAAGDWTAALMALATARPVVDRFFDDVMVMADDPAVRANRLALLSSVSAAMNRVADISKLAG